MTINWTKTHRTPTRQRNVISTRTSHEGLVLGAPVGRDVRIMSDVWEWARFVPVWNPTSAKIEEVCLGYSYGMSSETGESVEDATLEVKAAADAHRAKLAAEKAEREAAYRLAEAQAEHDRPLRGKTMQVVRGRKVPKGTVGTVVITGKSQYGPYAMLATTERKLANGRYADTVFINPAYLVNARPLEG